MKNSILVLCLSMWVIACNKANTGQSSNPDLVAAVEEQCSNNLIPIDYDKLLVPQKLLWDSTYKNHCCEPYLSTPETDWKNKFYFNLDYLEDSKKRAEWIADFRHAIWYEESQYYVENQHRIQSRAILEEITKPSVVFYTYTLYDIIQKVTPENYANDKYQYYITFPLDNRRTPVTSAVYKANYYSVQNIKAIANIYHLVDNSTFEFAKSTINKKEIQFFRVRKPNSDPQKNEYLYYDFSDNPTKKK